MNPTAVDIAPWPLGKKFIDAQARTFEVVQTIYGDQDSEIKFQIDFENGWSIVWSHKDALQTAVGFVQLGTDKVIIQPVDLMDEYICNGHLNLL